MGRKPKVDIDANLKEILQIIGLNLKEARLEKAFSQIRLAKEAKVSITTINEIETKKYRDIRLSTLVSLCSVLNIEVTRLFLTPDLSLSTSDKQKLLKASEDIFRITKKLDKT